MSFLTDYGVQARQLIAVPLLIVAEAVCAPRLSAIASHFEQAALIAPGDMPAFRSTVASTLRLRDSTRLEIALLAAAATIALFLMFNVPTYTFPAWHRLHVGIDVAMSPAGWWHGSVSVWILMILLLSWSWRLLLWARFLFLVSRMKLRLIAAHPDHAAGLRFTGISSQAFSVLAFALSTIVAGAAANRVMHDGASLLNFKFVVLGLVAVNLVLFVGPVTVFAFRLLDTWRRGCFEYGALANGVGLEMEQRWLNRKVDDSSLGVGDFSATTDLYQIVGNVYAMSVLPISLANVLVLVLAAIAPFVPVVLMAVPPDVILQKLTGVLL